MARRSGLVTLAAGIPVGLAGATRDATVRLGGLYGHCFEIFGSEEPDQDAVSTVIPGDAGYHADRAGGRAAVVLAARRSRWH